MEAAALSTACKLEHNSVLRSPMVNSLDGEIIAKYTEEFAKQPELKTAAWLQTFLVLSLSQVGFGFLVNASGKLYTKRFPNLQDVNANTCEPWRSQCFV